MQMMGLENGVEWKMMGHVNCLCYILGEQSSSTKNILLQGFLEKKNSCTGWYYRRALILAETADQKNIYDSDQVKKIHFM